MGTACPLLSSYGSTFGLSFILSCENLPTNLSLRGPLGPWQSPGIPVDEHHKAGYGTAQIVSIIYPTRHIFDSCYREIATAPLGPRNDTKFKEFCVFSAGDSQSPYKMKGTKNPNLDIPQKKAREQSRAIIFTWDSRRGSGSASSSCRGTYPPGRTEPPSPAQPWPWPDLPSTRQCRRVGGDQ